MNLTIRAYLPRRRVFLFLTAILIPCAVLLALGVRTMDQERQLEDKRRTDEQQRLVDQLRQGLLSQLEKIKLDEVTKTVVQGGATDGVPADYAVALIGLLVDGRLEIPWENNPRAQKFQEWLGEGSFATRIREAEAQELVALQYENAARQYREAIANVREPAQQTYAHLLLARTLQKMGHRQESEAEYGLVLASPPDLVDELGVPLRFYAAPALLQAGNKQKELMEWIHSTVSEDRLLPPAALRIARDIAAGLNASASVSRLEELIRDREQAETLQGDLSRARPATQDREPIWTSYGEPTWFTSVTSPVNNFDGLLIAVRAGEILKRVTLPEGPIRLATVTDTAGRALGESFPGLKVVMPPLPEQHVTLRQTSIISAFLLALALTLLAGYLLWRDVQRNLRIAEMRSAFVSSVTHELKTPLTAIRMFSETLRLDEEVDRLTRIEYLDTILHESERLSRLVDNVLDFGKIERGKKAYRFQPVRLEEVVEEAARAARYPLEQAGFALEIDAAPDLPTVEADSDALQQAILNLLTNAMKYSGESRHIGLRLDRENGSARIRVIDKGIGIAPQEQEHIFESFYRAPTADNQHIPGTGLGLTIVAHVAKAHGGAVEVVSTPGGGASFTIRLPLETRL
jgi:signal transduction histidine kinase